MPAVSVRWDAGNYDEEFGDDFVNPDGLIPVTLTLTSSQEAPSGGLAVKVDIDLLAGFFDDPATGTTLAPVDESATDDSDPDNPGNTLDHTVLTIPGGGDFGDRGIHHLRRYGARSRRGDHRGD